MGNACTKSSMVAVSPVRMDNGDAHPPKLSEPTDTGLAAPGTSLPTRITEIDSPDITASDAQLPIAEPPGLYPTLPECAENAATDIREMQQQEAQEASPKKHADEQTDVTDTIQQLPTGDNQSVDGQLMETMNTELPDLDTAMEQSSSPTEPPSNGARVLHVDPTAPLEFEGYGVPNSATTDEPQGDGVTSEKRGSTTELYPAEGARETGVDPLEMTQNIELAQSTDQNDEEEIDIDLDDPDTAAAAEKIQARYKGYKVRRNIASEKTDVPANTEEQERNHNELLEAGEENSREEAEKEQDSKEPVEAASGQEEAQEGSADPGTET